MSVRITGEFTGELGTRMVHEPSGHSIETDAPIDNGGRGSRFSPTDLAVASLGSCIMTILALIGKRDKLDLTGMRVDLEKHMSEKLPRRIAKLDVTLFLPGHLNSQMRKKMELAADACPVKNSLHPETEIKISFRYE